MAERKFYVWNLTSLTKPNLAKCHSGICYYVVVDPFNVTSVYFTIILQAAFAPVDLLWTYWHISFIVGSSFKFHALVEFCAVLSVKLTGIFLSQTWCAGSFALCISGLVKLTHGLMDVLICGEFGQILMPSGMHL